MSLLLLRATNAVPDGATNAWSGSMRVDEARRHPIASLMIGHSVLVHSAVSTSLYSCTDDPPDACSVALGRVLEYSTYSSGNKMRA